MRRVAAGALALVVAVTVWVGSGAPWWAPALLLAGGLAGRLVGLVVPGCYRRAAVPAGVAAAAVWLVAHLSAGGILVVGGAALLLVALVVEPPDGVGSDAGRGGTAWWARRAAPVTGTVAGLLLVGGLVLVGVEQVKEAAQRDRADQLAGDFARAQMLPSGPAAAVRALVRAIATDRPDAVCSAFAPTAADQLATAHGATDCAGAVHRLHARVRDPTRYARPDRGSITDTVTPDGESGSGDGCAATWTDLPRLLDPGSSSAATTPPGPLPGVLVGHRQLGQGYLIVDYQPC